jgi:hypothetical protein
MDNDYQLQKCKKLEFWTKHHEVLFGGTWVKISFWKYVWFKMCRIVTCASKGYPSEDKDIGFGHSAPRKESSIIEDNINNIKEDFINHE